MKTSELIAALQALPEAQVLMCSDEDPKQSSPVVEVGVHKNFIYLVSFRWIRPSLLLAQHRDRIVAILADRGFTNVRVFGSVANGTDTEMSILDLLVDEPEESMTLLDFTGAMIALEELLGERVHLYTPDNFKGAIRDTVLAEARPL